MSNTSEAFDHGLYLDIDTILDTRLATLYLIHPQLADRAFRDNYDQRREDSFGHISREKFSELYAVRDLDTLQNSTSTNVINFIKPIIKRMVLDTVTTPYAKDAKIWLNVYPFKLTEDEVRSIGDTLYEQVGKLIEIQLIYMSPTEVTPRWVKDNISVMIKYEYEKWLEIHTENFKSCQIPDIQLFVPKIYLNGVPSDEELEEIQTPYGGPFDLITLASSSIININFMEVSLFCSQMKVKNNYGIKEMRD